MHKGRQVRTVPTESVGRASTPMKEHWHGLRHRLPESTIGNNTILTLIDRLTKQAHFVPTKSTVDTAGTAYLNIQHVFRLHGIGPSIVTEFVSNRDPWFVWEFDCCIFNCLSVHLDMSTANHLQSDDLTERTHCVITQMLQSAVSHRQMD